MIPPGHKNNCSCFACKAHQTNEEKERKQQQLEEHPIGCRCDDCISWGSVLEGRKKLKQVQRELKCTGPVDFKPLFGGDPSYSPPDTFAGLRREVTRLHNRLIKTEKRLDDHHFEAMCSGHVLAIKDISDLKTKIQELRLETSNLKDRSGRPHGYQHPKGVPQDIPHRVFDGCDCHLCKPDKPTICNFRPNGSPHTPVDGCNCFLCGKERESQPDLYGEVLRKLAAIEQTLKDDLNGKSRRPGGPNRELWGYVHIEGWAKPKQEPHNHDADRAPVRGCDCTVCENYRDRLNCGQGTVAEYVSKAAIQLYYQKETLLKARNRANGTDFHVLDGLHKRLCELTSEVTVLAQSLK